MIGEIGGQALDIARTQGDINGLKEAKKSHPNLSADDLRKTDAYKKEMQVYGTGSDIQRGIQAATAALQGLAGGNMGQALTGAAAPYLAEQIHKLTEKDPAAKAVAHAVLGAVTSYAAGNSALAGAAGAVTGELMATAIKDQLYPGRDVSDLSETEKQTISILGTLAAGLAGGVAGNSTTDAVAGGQAGKNAVENNALRNGWGGLVPPLVERDASLAFDLAKKGVEPDEITKAIQRAHIGPSVGDEYKIHGSAKAGVSAGYGGGGYLESVLKEDKLSINAGFTKVFGWRAEAGYGLDFGPYPIDNFKPKYDYAGNISFGVISIDGTVGQEGVGGGIRIGGGFGASIRQTDNRGSQLPELNGTGGTELISWPIKKEK